LRPSRQAWMAFQPLPDLICHLETCHG
jgi:hypothetical protein